MKFILMCSVTVMLLFIATAESNAQGTCFYAVVINPIAVEIHWCPPVSINLYGGYLQRRQSGQTIFSTVPCFVSPSNCSRGPLPPECVCRDIVPMSGVWQYRMLVMDLDGTISFSDTITVNIGVTGVQETTPLKFSLEQNFPNPFNPTTEIRYQTSEVSRVTLNVFDMLGRKVATLVDEVQDAGFKSVEFSAKGGSASGGDATGLSSGVYFYRLQAGPFVGAKKLVLAK